MYPLCAPTSTDTIDIGRVTYLGSPGNEIVGAAPALSSRGLLRLSRPKLHEFFLYLATAVHDPLDVLRTAIDLRNAIIAASVSKMRGS